MSNNLTLEEAKPEDVELIFGLAHRIWHKHYPDIISPEQIDYMLEMMYAKEVLVEQMAGGVRFYLIGEGDDRLGFLACERKARGEYFIHKLYIEPRDQNKGLGTQVLYWLWRTIPDAKVVRLAVNRKNYKSVNFYFKNGFVIEKCVELQIGNGYAMDDFVMVKVMNEER